MKVRHCSKTPFCNGFPFFGDVEFVEPSLIKGGKSWVWAIFRIPLAPPAVNNDHSLMGGSKNHHSRTIKLYWWRRVGSKFPLLLCIPCLHMSNISNLKLFTLSSRRFPSSQVLKCWVELLHFWTASYLSCIIGTFWISKMSLNSKLF